MAHNEALTERVREALADVARVEEKKMFRGVTFMVNGKMCVSVGGDRILLRVDPALHEELTHKKGCSPMTMKGREYKGFIEVKEEVLKTGKELVHWLSYALAFNQFAKAAKKKRGAK